MAAAVPYCHGPTGAIPLSLATPTRSPPSRVPSSLSSALAGRPARRGRRHGAPAPCLSRHLAVW